MESRSVYILQYFTLKYLFCSSVTDDCNYEESCTLFVPGFVNIMSAGGVFETDEVCRSEMKKLGKEDMDIRLFKAEYIQEFLKGMIQFRIKKLLLPGVV